MLLGIGLMVLPPGLAGQLVIGQVVEAGTEAGVASAIVHLLDEEGVRASSAVTDGAGRFTLQAPHAGRWRVEAVRPGYLLAESELFEVAERGVVPLDAIAVELDARAMENLPVPGRTVVGRVLADGFDEPLPNVLVRVLDGIGDGVVAVFTDAAGRFRLEVPEAGEYRVEAMRLGDDARIREAVSVDEEEGTRLTLRLAYESILPGRETFHRTTNLTRGSHQFDRRREQGLGFFYDREMIARMEDVTLPSHVFLDVPGADVIYPVCGEEGYHAFRTETDPRSGGACLTSERATVRTFQGWGCMLVLKDHGLRPVSWSEGTTGALHQPGLRSGRTLRDRAERPQPLSAVTIDASDLDDIEGIEVYRSYREVPDELKESLIGPLLWPTAHLGGCGVAIIWTRAAW